MNHLPPPYGLAWQGQGLYLEAVWAVEPDVATIESLASRHLKLNPEQSSPDTVSVSFLAEGCVHKVYKVDTGDRGTFVMRVGLPLDMPFKMESEVATGNFLRHNLSIPTPKVLVYDPSNDNELRFPWMLMEYVPGKAGRDKKWRDISMAKKERIIKQMAHFHSRLFDIHFDRIGSLTTHGTESTRVLGPVIHDETERVKMSFDPIVVTVSLLILVFCLPHLGLVVATILLWSSSHPTPTRQTLGDLDSSLTIGKCSAHYFQYAHPDAPRGPFDNTTDWVYGRLYEARDRLIQDFKPNAPTYRWGDQQYQLCFLDNLIDLVPTVFPPNPACKEPIVLLAPDLHWGNTLLDEDDDLIAFIDWEYLATGPQWEACRLPFIFDPRDWEEPDKAEYLMVPDKDAAGEASDGSRAVDEEEPYSNEWWYWTKLESYENTVLKKLFLSEMDRLNPEWMREYRGQAVKREFIDLMLAAESGDLNKQHYWDWIEALEEGESTEGILSGFF